MTQCSAVMVVADASNQTMPLLGTQTLLNYMKLLIIMIITILVLSLLYLFGHLFKLNLNLLSYLSSRGNINTVLGDPVISVFFKLSLNHERELWGDKNICY